MTGWRKGCGGSRRGGSRQDCYHGGVRNEFTAMVEPAEEGGFWAYCLEIPGANGQGETVEETLADLKSAIEDAVEEILPVDGRCGRISP